MNPTEEKQAAVPKLPDLEPTDYDREKEAVSKIAEAREKIRKELSKVIVGQEEVIDELLIALLCGGHCLITGAPGLAKTLLVNSLADLFRLSFQRIQFTPDLMPTDITGTEMISEGSEGRKMVFQKGPIFANMILADEINRTPPKTQAALLEAMQEKQVTVAGQTRALEEPFIVFATQNPIEHEGTYPLPEAQLDRFFFDLRIGYPSIKEEEEIVHRTTGRAEPELDAVLDGESLIKLQDAVLDVPLPQNVVDCLLDLVNRTRPESDLSGEYVKNYVSFGAGPRASQCLARAARGLALLRGEPSASVQEIRDLAMPVLRHRIIPNYNATGEGIGVEEIVTHLLDDLKV